LHKKNEKIHFNKKFTLPFAGSDGELWSKRIGTQYNNGSWTGTVCSQPLMVYISVQKERHSHEIISRNKEFVINLVNKDLIDAKDWCGVYSGKKLNKFTEMKLSKEKAQIVTT
jgi:hypothetical protein